MFIKLSSLQKIVSKFTLKKFYEIDPRSQFHKTFWGVNLLTLFETIKKIRRFFHSEPCKDVVYKKVSKFTPKSFMRSAPDQSNVFEILTCSILNLHVRLQAR
jgi:hypothetical protein